MNLEILCLMVFAHLVSASPLPFNHAASSQSVALINCNDFLLVQKLEESAIPFTCLPNSYVVATTDNLSFNEIMGVENNLNGLREDPLTRSGPEITLVLDAPMPNEEIDITATGCVDSKRCGVQEFSSQRCPSNHVFVAEIGQCIPFAPARNTDRESFFNPNSEVLNESECKEGFVFNLEKGKCVIDKKIFSVSPSFQSDDAPSSFENRDFGRSPSLCDDDSIFVPEVGICLPLGENGGPSFQLQNTEPVVVNVEFPSAQNCPEGTIFNSEVGICLIVKTKPQDSSQEAPVALSLVSDLKPAGSVPLKVTAWTDPRKCGKDSVYVSEIDRCVPLDQEKPMGDSPAPSHSNLEIVHKPTPDPFRPTLAPLTSEQIGRSKCPKGQVYVSEIDFCLDPQKQKNPPS